jgi:hypothetical protein
MTNIRLTTGLYQTAETSWLLSTHTIDTAQYDLCAVERNTLRNIKNILNCKVSESKVVPVLK